MLSIGELYADCEKLNIQVLECPLPENGSVSILDGQGACHIGMDHSVLDAAAQERVHLGHELGHCATGSFYNRYSPYDLRRKHENRADKWAIRRIIPVESLDEAVAEGCTQIWELAEWFGVTEQFMRKAVCLHVHGNTATELYF